MEHDSSCVLKSVRDGQMQLKMANSFYVTIAQNTKKSPCEFFEGSGYEHNGGLATRGRQNQRHELCARFKSHRALYSNRQRVDYSTSFSIFTDTILSPVDIVDTIK